MALGAGATQSSPMEDYIRSYGARLQSLLAGQPGGGALGGGLPIGRGGGPLAPVEAGDGGGGPGGPSALDTAAQPSDLGPDVYRNTGLERAPQAQPPAQAPPSPQGPPSAAQGPQGAPPQPSPGGAPGGKGTSLRDAWYAQSKEVRQQNLDKLQNHLKAAHETIDSAYDTMMKQLGGRPDASLTKQDKGMLLMEFGMRMMEHSSGRYGFGRDTGAAAGAAGVETLGSMRGLQQQKLGRQQYYDKLQEQLTVARGKEHAQLAARSALEEGRDIRAQGAQDTSIERTDTQQAGAAARTQSRNEAAAARTAAQQSGADRRSALAHQGIVRTFVNDQGHEIGIRRSGKTEDLGPAAAGSSGMGGRGGKGFASEANYRMYMETYGKDDQDQPLTGDALRQVHQDALRYASNPHAFALTDAQYRQMAEKSADNYIRSNQLSWAGSSDQEIAAKRNAFAEEAFQRMKRNGTAGPSAGVNIPNRPKSALAGGGTGAPGAPPTAPPSGRTVAPPASLDHLAKNPATAAVFLKHYGYLPAQFHRYLAPAAPTSALQ